MMKGAHIMVVTHDQPRFGRLDVSERNEKERKNFFPLLSTTQTENSEVSCGSEHILQVLLITTKDCEIDSFIDGRLAKNTVKINMATAFDVPEQEPWR